MIDTWIQDCQAGKTRAYAEVVRELRPKLLDFLYRMTQNREVSEEIGQEAFLKAFQQLAKFDAGKSSFSTWLLTLGRNLCIDHFRKQKISLVPEEEASTLVSLHPAPRDKAWENELGQIIAKAVQNLDLPYREVFILKEYQQLEIEEIVMITATTAGTIKSRLFRARQALQEALAPMLKKSGQYYG